MIERITYECSFCGRFFPDKDKCDKHEKRHIKPKEITEFKYTPGLDYPSEITVKMKDNVTIKYMYQKILNK